MSRDTTDIANELLAENARLKAQIAALSADNRNYSELLQYHIDRQAKAEAQLAQRDAQIAALTAENVALKSFFMTAIELSFQGCDFDGGYINDHALQLGLIREVFYSKDQHENLVYDAGKFEDGGPVYFINETPATDAAANALRAEGIQMLLNKYAPHTIASSEASEFASQLREGK